MKSAAEELNRFKGKDACISILTLQCKYPKYCDVHLSTFHACMLKFNPKPKPKKTTLLVSFLSFQVFSQKKRGEEFCTRG